MGGFLETLPRKKILWDFRKKVNLLRYQNVHTVCEESRCPNRYECSSHGLATFLIGGRFCTRSCRFCHIETAKPQSLSQIAEKEKSDILQYALENKLNFVVITSVARDDAEEELARHFADIAKALAENNIDCELLIPDFHAQSQFLKIIGEANPLVVAHNIETTKNLHRKIRPQAQYERSLKVYQFFREKYPKIIRKAGFMVGLGESLSEIKELLYDLYENGVEVVTVGQYLQPSPSEVPVQHIYTPEEFGLIESFIKEFGFAAYEIGPFVRSSYMASRTIYHLRKLKNR